MKNNVFLSLCSLIVTTFLLFFLVYGWYVSNTEVSATGILASTKGEDYDARLERAIVDVDGSITSWEECKSISFSNIEPGSVMVFRLAVKSKLDTEINLTVSFDEISSIITPGKIEVKNDKVYEIKTDVAIYDLVNGMVSVSDETISPASNKVLYHASAKGDLSLADYKIEDTFKGYDLGSVAPQNITLPDSNGGFLLDSNNGFTITAGLNEENHYFALEFNEALSNKNVNGYISSNMYLYQTIKIGRISIVK